MSFRCDLCGNKTRFDIFETKRVRAFHHFTLGGDDAIEEEEVLAREVEQIVCRWCGSADAIVEEPRATLDATPTGEQTRDLV